MPADDPWSGRKLVKESFALVRVFWKPEGRGLDENLLSFQKRGVCAIFGFSYLFSHRLIINLLNVDFHYISTHPSLTEMAGAG